MSSRIFWEKLLCCANKSKRCKENCEGCGENASMRKDSVLVSSCIRTGSIEAEEEENRDEEKSED
jgi:hypothetical protein